jgi:predicted proteasome-type protease
VFREQTDERGRTTQKPSEFLDAQLSDGVVLDAVIVEREQPRALHTDRMEEDDAFLSTQAEAWDYDVADDRQQEFIDAMRNSGVVMDYQVLGDEDSVSAV